MRICAARFHRVRNQAIVFDVQFRDLVCLGKRRIDRRFIAQRPHIANIVRRDIVYRGFAGRRAAGIDHRRQHVVINLDQFGRILGLRVSVRDYQRHLVTDKPNPADRQHRMRRLLHRLAVHVGNQPAARQAAHFSVDVLAGKNSHHAGGGTRFGMVNGFDHGMRVRRAQKIRVALIGKIYVIRVLPGTGEKAVVFLAFKSLSDCVAHLILQHCDSLFRCAQRSFAALRMTFH